MHQLHSDVTKTFGRHFQITATPFGVYLHLLPAQNPVTFNWYNLLKSPETPEILNEILGCENERYMCCHLERGGGGGGPFILGWGGVVLFKKIIIFSIGVLFVFIKKK